MGIDELHLHRGRRSSSTCAKYADALRKISFVRFSSRTSRSTSFTHLALHLLHALAFRGRQATAEPAIALGLPDPLPERLGRAPQLARNRLDRGPLGRVLSPMLADQPHRSLSYFGGIPTQS